MNRLRRYSTSQCYAGLQARRTSGAAFARSFISPRGRKERAERNDLRPCRAHLILPLVQIRHMTRDARTVARYLALLRNTLRRRAPWGRLPSAMKHRRQFVANWRCGDSAGHRSARFEGLRHAAPRVLESSARRVHRAPPLRRPFVAHASGFYVKRRHPSRPALLPADFEVCLSRAHV